MAPRGRATQQSPDTRKTNISLFPIKMIAKLEWITKHRTITEYHNWRNNQQRINNNKTTALERRQSKPLREGGGGLNALYWYQILELDSSFVTCKHIA